MSPFGIETLPAEIRDALRTIPVLAERLDEVAAHTSVLEGVDDRVATIETRMATIEAAMPQIVEVLTQLTKSLSALDANLAALQESMEPVGRLADKLPGSSRRS